MVELIIDTTYLLPLFGVRVGLRDFDRLFPRLLDEFDVAYSPVSLIEAKWIILALTRRNIELRVKMLGRYIRGLKGILAEDRLKATELTNPLIEEVADKLLLNVGLKDYFDRMIYSTTKYYNATLLTEDEELMKIAEAKPGLTIKITSWNKMIEKLS